MGQLFKILPLPLILWLFSSCQAIPIEPANVPATKQLVTLFRYYNEKNDDHLMSLDPSLEDENWILKQTVGTCHPNPVEEGKAIYEFVTNSSGHHKYTTRSTDYSSRGIFIKIVCYTPLTLPDGTVTHLNF